LRQADRAAETSTLAPRPFATPIQAKLMVGGVNDPAEREADRVADAVVQNIDAGVTAAPGVPSLQRSAVSGAQVPPETEQAIDQSRGGGSPLPAELGQSMGGAMGANFGGVRIH